MFEIVIIVLLAAHLLLVDLAMAGPLVCVWLEWRGARSNDPLTDRASRALAGYTLVALLGGVLVGALLLGLRWWFNDAKYFSAVAVVPVDRLWFALGELAFSLACLGGYMALARGWPRRRIFSRIVAIAGGSNLLMHFPALFAILSVLTTRPEMLGQPLTRADYRRLLIDPEVLSRVAHVWLAAFAVTGIVLMMIAVKLASIEEERVARERLVRAGAGLALFATFLQMPVGMWVALEMPRVSLEPLFGGDWIVVGLFLAALTLSLALMQWLVAIALGDHDRRRIHRALATVATIVLLMTATRCRLQNEALAGNVAPQLTAGYLER